MSPEKKSEYESTEGTCIWKGCRRKIPLEDTLPIGWKCLVLSNGSLFIEDNLLGADVDGVLCPEHAAQLKNQLKLGEASFQ